jgi:tripartite-type tricarboxylate transporter receptor subunit TctC
MTRNVSFSDIKAATLSRRLALCTLTAASLFAAGSLWAQAPAWPTRPVKFIVPAPAGTAPDIAARIVGERLARIWNQAVVIDNRPGAGGIVGFAALKNAERDDHQFAFVPASALTLSPYMFKSTTLDIVKDFAPVAFIGESPMMLAVNANSPINSFKELMVETHRLPDTLVVASPVLNSLPHLTTLMLEKQSATKLRPVTYPGSSQSNAAVLGSEAQIVIDGLPALDALVKGGRLKALATFAEKRLTSQPNLPTVAETYPGFVVNGWFGVVALNSMSPAIIERVNRDIGTVIMAPEVVEKFTTFALFPKPMTATNFGAFVNGERTRWEQVLRAAGAQPMTQ